MFFNRNTKEVTILAKGLTCSHCSNRLKDALLKNKNIKKVTKIELNKIDDEITEIVINCTKNIELSDIEQQLIDLGFEFISAK